MALRLTNITPDAGQRNQVRYLRRACAWRQRHQRQHYVPMGSQMPTPAYQPTTLLMLSFQTASVAIIPVSKSLDNARHISANGSQHHPGHFLPDGGAAAILLLPNGAIKRRNTDGHCNADTAMLLMAHTLL